MLYAVANRYNKAILKSWKFEELESLLEMFKTLEIALKNSKFLEIMHSPYILLEEKKKMLFNLINTQDKKIQNLLSLMLQNKRIEAIPYLCVLLQNHINEKNKTYQGVIYAKENLDKEAVARIQNNLARHFGVALDLICKQTQKDEISLIVEGLGMEISFSNQRFLEDLKTHILKAI